MNERDNSLLLDYWKEFYGEEIRKRELLILKLRLALETLLKEIGEIYGSEKS